MRVLVQRVRSAHVLVDDCVVGSIDNGIVALVGITHSDTLAECQWMVDKLLSLRIFADDEQKMNRSITDVGGGILVVSQFTLYGELAKGTRPSFVKAAGGEIARPLFDQMVTLLRERSSDQHNPVTIATGVFGAMMHVHLVNDGPVTLMLERTNDK